MSIVMQLTFNLKLLKQSLKCCCRFNLGTYCYCSIYKSENYYHLRVNGAAHI